MEKIVDKNKCTGCTACMNICPTGAISMKEDNEGFKYPTIDQKKCINCGLCKRTCPVINTSSNESLNESFIGYNKNEEIRLKSSSGGIFSILANYVLDNSGIVIGAAFIDNKLKHIAIEKKEYLYKLRSSKYLQSNLEDIFKYIKNNIKNKKILFTGTPCQTAGLKAFLKKDYDNLICIDVVCHGVPSPLLFSKYVSELEKENNDKLINYDFRDKSKGWTPYLNSAKFKNKTVKTKAIDNPYMKLFLSDVALRESCFNCNFKLGNKYSDITLGDFWGVNNYYPEMNDNKGISAIIINTEKGKEIFKNISNDIIFKECKLEEIVNGNPSLKYSGKYPTNRKKFFNDFDKYTTVELSKKYSKKNKLYKKVMRKIKSILIKKR